MFLFLYFFGKMECCSKKLLPKRILVARKFIKLCYINSLIWRPSWLHLRVNDKLLLLWIVYILISKGLGKHNSHHLSSLCAPHCFSKIWVFLSREIDSSFSSILIIIVVLDWGKTHSFLLDWASRSGWDLAWHWF